MSVLLTQFLGDANSFKYKKCSDLQTKTKQPHIPIRYASLISNEFKEMVGNCRTTHTLQRVPDPALPQFPLPKPLHTPRFKDPLPPLVSLGKLTKQASTASTMR